MAKISKVRKNGYWLSFCQTLKNDNPMIEKDAFEDDTKIDLYNFMSELDKCSTSKDILTTDAGSNYYVGGQVYTFEQNQRDLVCSYGPVNTLSYRCGSCNAKKKNTSCYW